MGRMSSRHPDTGLVAGSDPSRRGPGRFDYPLLAVGVVAVSFSAVLIRLAHAPTLTIALYRNAIAAALVLPAALARHREELRSLSRRQMLLAAGSGALLALHFATWIPSLSYTTVAASVVLVTTQPVWSALAGRAIYGDRLPRAAWAGIALALAGAALISGGDVTVSTRAAFGDLLALIGGVTAAGYFFVGQNLRRSLSLLPYVAIAYTTCAILLLPVTVISGSRLGGFAPTTWLLLGLMAVGPSILGHTIFNYLLARIDAVRVGIAIMGEPVGATLLALAFFGELPTWSAVAGGALVLAGIYFALVGRRRTDPDAAPLE
jgi:drug/metabolite transporter (DMT)-like permease